MIGGAVQGPGGPALANYLADAQPGSSHGLMSEDIKDQVDELTDMATASGQKQAIRHAYASPPPGAEWGAKEWDAYWTLYERAQGLQGCAYSEAVHDKPGEDGRPPHRHRVYLALTERGTLVRDGWSYAKQEAVSRIMEADTGAAFVKGAHNVRAARIASGLGREDVAQAMTAAGLLDGSRARADLSPAQRAQQERTGIMKADVARGVAAAWKASDGGAAFMAALHERGLWLARGTKKDGVPVILDGSGGTHGLRQMLGMAAREAGQPAPRQAAIAAFLGGVVLPLLDEARAAQHASRFACEHAAGAEPAAPVMDGAVPVHDHEAAPGPLDDRAPAPDHGQPLPSVTEQVAAAAPSLDRMHEPSDAVATSGGGGGGASDGGDGGGGGGAMGTESIDGPGEPPGPGASIQEVQRYRERRFAYEERKGAAWKRQQAALAAENERDNKKGGTHAHAQPQDHGGGAGAPSPLAILSALGRAHRVRPAAPADAGHGGHGHAHLGGDEGGQGNGPARRGHPRGDAGAAAGRAAGPAAGAGGRGGPGAGGGARAQGGGGGAAGLAARAQGARLARGLLAVDMTGLRAAVEALRTDPAAAILDREAARIAEGRAREPHPCPLDRDPDACARAARSVLWRPVHEAREALPAAMQRTHAATAAWCWWKPGTWREHRDAAAGLHYAHAAVTAATPSGDALDEAGDKARMRAEAARDAHAAWKAGTGQVLDRAGHLLAGIRAALDGGDLAMRRILLDEGVAAAMRVQAGHEAVRQYPGGEHGHELDTVVVAFHGPR